MATVSDITSQPLSGYNYIDALLSNAPSWNYLLPSRSTLFYTFSTAVLDPYSASTVSNITPFTASQTSWTLGALSDITEITGITFAQTGDPASADIHFANGNILLGSQVSGFTTYSYGYSYTHPDILTSYEAEAWVYLDSAEWGLQNADLTPGGAGYETLLHELGHALGLKHPFEDSPILPANEDNTENTLMSYTDAGGYHSTYSPYDIAALLWLYGNDGLGGMLGVGAPGVYLQGLDTPDGLAGSTGNDVLVGGSGNDTLAGGMGDDTLDGGPGADTLDGGSGMDTVTFAASASGVQVYLTATTGAGLGGDAQGDTYISIENIIGSDYADVLSGPVGVANSVMGGAGDDIIYGEGIDIVNGGDGNDVFFGGQGGALNLNLATASLETVWGSYVGDLMNGASASANLVLVGQGLEGGANADTMQGGSGNDFIYYRAGDSINGGSGSDWAVATLSSTGVSLNLAATGFENAWGSPFDDVLTAAGSASTVVLVGDTGNDTLTGGNATDYLYGFGGNDVLIGGPGGDVLVGGDGNDQFAYTSRTGSGFDSIFDFTSGADQFRMTASEYGMTVGGSLSAGSSFISGAAPVATSAIPTFLYNTATGILGFDLDGTGGSYASISIAQLSAAPALMASDFAFV